MAWIESHQGLPSHPKTKKLRRLLNISTPTAVGHLHMFWWWAMDHAQDGDLSRYDVFDIADACEWEGDAHQLFHALCEARFIECIDTRYVIHDWYEYAGKLIELRKKDAERKKNSRNKRPEQPNPEDVHGTSDGHPEESDGNLPESICNPNLNPNLNLKPNKELKAYRPETIDLTNHLIFWMKQNNSKAKVPTSLDKWNDEMDKLERIDKYDYTQIRTAIDWCQQDSFWKSNILSVPKLREKMSTIVLQMQRKSGNSVGKVSSFTRLQQLAEEEYRREASGNY